MNVEDIANSLQKGEVNAVALTQYYIDRINKLDKSQNINAVIVINPDALQIAKEVDKEIKAGNYKGKLHGIPILIKDNIDTKDKMPNTAGSLLMAGNFPKEDAFIVKQLRKSGAVLLGKTNLSEWANFRSEKSSSGWSSVGGQTRNPHNIDMTPCGSSAGSGAAIASGFAPIAIGTETNGSIACPAAVNGVVGIKPTVGLWSRSGIIPISFTQDTGGPMARSVKDAAYLLSALVGKDASDSKSVMAPITDYTINCKSGYLKGKRLGVDSSFYTLSKELQPIMNDAFAALEAQGAILVPIVYRSQLSNTNGAGYDVLLYEFKDGLNNYLKTATQKKYPTLEALIAGNEAMKDKIMPLFGQEIFIKSQAKGDLNDEDYKKAIRDANQKSKSVIDDMILTYKLDALIGPTLGTAWPIDPTKRAEAISGPATYVHAARAGYPHITVPMGAINQLPVGLCLFGSQYSEAKLIGMAYDFEIHTNKIIWPATAMK